MNLADENESGRPKGAVPAPLNLPIFAARSSQAMVQLLGGWAYRTGMFFWVDIQYFGGDRATTDEVMPNTSPENPSVIRNEGFTFTVRCDDGRTASVSPAEDETLSNKAPIMLLPEFGSGSWDRWSLTYWMSPLPKGQGMSIELTWPRKDIDLREIRISAETISNATEALARNDRVQGTFSGG